MTRKNKLYKHHKPKSYFYLKNFSFALIALLGIGTAVTVPTYIATHRAQEVTIKAESNEAKENDNTESNNNSEESEELLNY